MKKILSLIAIANLLFIVGCNPNRNASTVTDTNHPNVKDDYHGRQNLLQKIIKLDTNIKKYALEISKTTKTLREVNIDLITAQNDLELEVKQQGQLITKNNRIKEQFNRDFVASQTQIATLKRQINELNSIHEQIKEQAQKINIQAYSQGFIGGPQFPLSKSQVKDLDSKVKVLESKNETLNALLTSVNNAIFKLQSKNSSLEAILMALKSTNINFEKQSKDILYNFEGDNNNRMVSQPPLRKMMLDILDINQFTKEEVIKEHNLNNWPYKNIINKSNPDLEEIRRFQKWQDHLYRVSENSSQSYHKFSQQVLNVNSPSFYKNPQEVINDFKDVHLRDGINVQLDLKKAFELSGTQSQNIVNMYNYFIRYYGKENAKRWIFDLAIKDKFITRPSGVLAFVYEDLEWGNQHMKLRTEAFDSESITKEYDVGHFTTNNVTATFIHEYGHAFENALKLQPNTWNMNYLPDKIFDEQKRRVYPQWKSFELEAWQSNNPNANAKAKEKGYKKTNKDNQLMEASKEFFYFIGQKIGYQRKDIDFSYNYSTKNYELKDNQETKNTFVFAKMFSDGAYGRSQYREHFAEIFAYWLIKPIMQPDHSKLPIRWTTINEFFLNYLPTRYNLVINA